MPESRREFWLAKISGNKLRDQRNIATLSNLGWRVRVVWECELRQDQIIESIMEWLGTKPERAAMVATSAASMVDGNAH